MFFVRFSLHNFIVSFSLFPLTFMTKKLFPSLAFEPRVTPMHLKKRSLRPLDHSSTAQRPNFMCSDRCKLMIRNGSKRKFDWFELDEILKINRSFKVEVVGQLFNWICEFTKLHLARGNATIILPFRLVYPISGNFSFVESKGCVGKIIISVKSKFASGASYTVWIPLITRL